MDFMLLPARLRVLYGDFVMKIFARVVCSNFVPKMAYLYKPLFKVALRYCFVTDRSKQTMRRLVDVITVLLQTIASKRFDQKTFCFVN